MSLSENESVSHLDDYTQLRAYLLKVFADLNRDMDFKELNFNEEDTMLASEFVAPDLLPGQFEDGISPDFFRTTDADVSEIDLAISRLTVTQRAHFDKICDKVLNHDPNAKNSFFLDAPAGSGKTFVTNLMIRYLRGKKQKLVLAVASTGIAALLLDKGVTAHKMFVLLLVEEKSCEPSPTVICQPTIIQRNIIRDCDIIFWDKITMTPKSIITAVDILLRFEKKCDNPFGGCVVVLSGDFRQCLPVVTKGPTLEEVYQRSVLCALFANDIQFLKLTENMRILFTCPPEERAVRQAIAKKLLELGSGFNIAHGDGFENLSDLGIC